MTDWILMMLKESGTVTKDNDAIVKYGLQKAESFLTDLLITFVSAAFFGIVVEGLIFWLALFAQRLYIGGFHAKSRMNCMIISWIVTLLSFLIIKTNISNTVLLYVMMAAVILIWVKAPVEAENKPLSLQETVIYRKIGRWIVGSCSAAALIARFINLNVIFKPLALAIIMTGLGITAALVLNHPKASNCRDQ